MRFECSKGKFGVEMKKISYVGLSNQIEHRVFAKYQQVTSACKRCCLRLPHEISGESPGRGPLPSEVPLYSLLFGCHPLHVSSGIVCGKIVSIQNLRRMSRLDSLNAVNIVGCLLKAVGLLVFIVKAHSLNLVTYFSKY